MTDLLVAVVALGAVVGAALKTKQFGDVTTLNWPSAMSIVLRKLQEQVSHQDQILIPRDSQGLEFGVIIGLSLAAGGSEALGR